MNKIILKAGTFGLIDDDNFDPKLLAEGEYQFCSETEETIFMGQDKSVDLAGTNALYKLAQPSLLVVEA